MILVIRIGHGGFEEDLEVGPGGAGIKVAFAVAPDGKTQDHSGGGGKGNRGNEAGETKQAAERQQRENQPHWVQSDRFADELRRQNIALEKLTDQNNAKRRGEQF